MIKRLLSILITLVYAAVSINTVNAEGLSPAQKNLYAGGIGYFDIATCENPGPADSNTGGGPLVEGDSVYILGDSITDGAASSYKTAFEEGKKISVDISAVAGRSWKTPGNTGAGSEGTTGTGKEALKADSAKVEKAKAIVIALGTNGYLQNNPIEDVIATIKEVNVSAPIYWVNIANVGQQPQVPDFNSALLTASQQEPKFTIIDWAKTVDPSGDGTTDASSLLRDGTHPNDAGYKKLSELVVSAVTGPGGATTEATGACACKAGASLESGDMEKNAEAIWKFFRGKGLSAEQVAGMLGNMQSESHLEPRLVQYGMRNSRGEISKPGDPSSLDDVPPEGGSTGYGIVQFTPATKLLTPPGGKQLNGEPKDLDYQVNFIWEQFQSNEKAAYDHLRGTTTVADAAVSFELKYERHAGSGQPERAAQAQEWFDKLKDVTGDGTVGFTAGCAAGNKLGDFNGYFQTDPQWASTPYANGTIGGQGCGATSLASIISTLTGDASVTPISIVNEIKAASIPPTTDSLQAFTTIPKQHNLTMTNYSPGQFDKALEQVDTSNGNALMIANVKPGYWTSLGHYFVIRGTGPDGKVQVHDVGESTASHPKTDKTYDKSFFTSGETNPINFMVISK